MTTRRTSPGAASETNSVKPSAWARPTPPGRRRSISTSRIFSSGSPKVICRSKYCTNLSVLLTAPLADDRTNDKSADCSQNEDGRVRLGDNGIREAQEYAEDQTIKPRGTGNLATPRTNPIAKRLKNAPAKAALLSVNASGIMEAADKAPQTMPHIAPSMSFDIADF